MPSTERDVITIGQIEIRYLLDGTVHGTASGLFELVVQPGARVPPPHSHANNEEILYCLEGRLRSIVGGVVRDLEPGEQNYTPRGTVHAFINPFDRVARALVILTPDIGAQYFRDVRDVIGSPGGPNPAKLVEVMNRYGLALP